MTEERAYDDVLHTGVVTEGVENSDEVVQAGPVVWVTVQSLLKGMSSQRNAQESHSHLPNLVPHVHVSGIQHNSLKKEEQKMCQSCTLTHLVAQNSAMPITTIINY